MTAKLAVMVLSAAVLMADTANAAGRTRARPAPQAFGQSRGFATRPAPQVQQRRTDRPYESDAGDSHWYPNPDRAYPVPPHDP